MAITQAVSNTILLDRRAARVKRFANLRPKNVTSVSRIPESIALAEKNTLWISYEQSLTNGLLKALDWPPRQLGRIVLVHRLLPEGIPVLRNCFDRVAYRFDGAFLPPEELSEVLAADNGEDLILGGTIDKTSRTITLWKGNLDSVTVPFAAFRPSGDGIRPDFSSFAVTDYGQTLVLGEYQAATDAVLYELDPQYRRRIAKRRRATEKTFGASLRRLRKQRGLLREDFPPLSPKTLARIEQGKVEPERLRRRTLDAICNALCVSVEEIGAY